MSISYSAKTTFRAALASEHLWKACLLLARAICSACSKRRCRSRPVVRLCVCMHRYARRVIEMIAMPPRVIGVIGILSTDAVDAVGPYRCLRPRARHALRRGEWTPVIDEMYLDVPYRQISTRSLRKIQFKSLEKSFEITSLKILEILSKCLFKIFYTYETYVSLFNNLHRKMINWSNFEMLFLRKFLRIKKSFTGSLLTLRRKQYVFWNETFSEITHVYSGCDARM